MNLRLVIVWFGLCLGGRAFPMERMITSFCAARLGSCVLREGFLGDVLAFDNSSSAGLYAEPLYPMTKCTNTTNTKRKTQNVSSPFWVDHFPLF